MKSYLVLLEFQINSLGFQSSILQLQRLLKFNGLSL
jgi:hypothetical protein